VDLISKKELLANTGISYGQLYRWKREGLLPEEWFIKQSAFTGQETFFPRDQIVSRIKAILELKDKHSLEELARILISDSEAVVALRDLKEIPALEEGFVSLASRAFDDKSAAIGDIAVAYALFRRASELGISEDVLLELIDGAVSAGKNLPINDMLCTVIEAEGRYHVCLTTGPARPAFDRAIKNLSSVSVGETMNELRIKLQAVKNDRNAEER
jgi:hypothetical protein